ncbi:MAG: hypothetical protein COB02_02920 [Candidatus Cloacimonadota bacterium]|nr:MAG: hypothetical protein COB02_02920 [Candidatus Cloacimonadota bacterium]
MSDEDDKFLELQNLLADAGLIDHGDKIGVESSVFEELDKSAEKVVKKPRKKKLATVEEKVKNKLQNNLQNKQEEPEENLVELDDAQEKAEIELSFSEDLMEAYISIVPVEGNRLDRRFFERFFLFRGLRYGIDWEAIDSIIETSLQLVETVNEVIAKGKPVKFGRPAQILKYFEEAKTFKFLEATEEEKKDHYRKHRINMVSKDLLLAEKLNAIPGINGKNTKGEVIPSVSSREVRFQAGKGCIVNGDQIYSEIDGRPSIDNTGRIEVVPLYTVYGDVDLSVGNLEFNGTIEIMGNVQAGFTIKAGGSIFVKGSVESSDLIADEDITIKGSLTSSNQKGVIRAKQNCVLSHCNYANIEVGGDLYVDKELVNSTVFVAGNLTFNSSKGAIIGGKTSVGKDVSLYNLGSGLGVTTLLNVGQGEIIRRKLVHVIKRVDELYKQLNLVKQAMKKFQSEEVDKEFPNMKRNQLEKALTNNNGRLTKALLHEREEKLELEKKLNTFSAHLVKIRNKIHPGVRLSIGSAQFNIDKRKTQIEYYEDMKSKRIFSRPIDESTKS